MTGHVVELVCDRGVWHERKDGSRRYWVLARFMERETPSEQGFMWDVFPGRARPAGDGLEALRWETNPPRVLGEDVESVKNIAPDLTFGEFLFSPCQCGFPIAEMIGKQFIEGTLNSLKDERVTRIKWDDFAARVRSLETPTTISPDTVPSHAILIVHAPAPVHEWQRYQVTARSNGVIPARPPRDYRQLIEAQHAGGKSSGALIVMCDGGGAGRQWHRRHGARFLARIEFSYGKDIDSEYRYEILDGLKAASWGLYPSENIDTETLDGLTFFPCQCGRRDLPLLDLEAAALVVAALYKKDIRFVTIDELAYMVKHA